MTLFLGVLLSAALGGFVQSVTGFGAAVVLVTVCVFSCIGSPF